MKVPVLYFGVFDDGTHMDWFKKTKLESIAKLFQEDQLTIPGFSRSSPFSDKYVLVL
jgi:hypothetical protein